MHDIINGFLRFQQEVYPTHKELFKTLATGNVSVSSLGQTRNPGIGWRVMLR